MREFVQIGTIFFARGIYFLELKSIQFFVIYEYVTTQEAVKGELWRLRDAQGNPPGVMGLWPSRAVTFLDNHDTGSTQVIIFPY